MMKELTETLEISNRRYLGSKAKLIPFIKEIIEKYCGDFSSFFDVFGGTGVVSYNFNKKNIKIIINDLLKSNEVAYKTWLGNEKFDKEKIIKIINEFNNIKSEELEDNYVSKNFGGNFFSLENAKKIGYIREEIEKLDREGKVNDREKAILLTSLLYAMDKVANTCGHYDAYRKKMDTTLSLYLQVPKIDDKNNLNNEIYNIDSNLLVKNIKADIVYIDPPYNSRQYGDAYHLLENITTWEKPEVVGVAKKMPNRTHIKSKYCTVAAPFIFKELINELDCKYILVSYNNMGEKGAGRSQAKISDKEIEDILKERGEVTIFEQEYRHFTTGKSEITGHKERIFLCKVYSKKKNKEEKEKNELVIKSPLNYTGGKAKLFPQLNKFFPKNINTFYDIFTGGVNVGINVKAKNIICIDKEEILIELYRLLQNTEYRVFEKNIYEIIDKYNLSLTSKYGYEYYNCTSDKGVGYINKNGYLKLREDFNFLKSSVELTNKKLLYMFLVLIIYGFNNQIRFNRGRFNIPVGKRDFNNSLNKKLKLFKEEIDKKRITFITMDFREINLEELTSNDFVYFDPPYLLGIASYNENNGWNEKDEKDLYEILDKLNEKKIKFALSNVIEHKGKRHILLEEWVKKNNYNINILNFDYSNSNYQKNKVNEKKESYEVLITNYTKF